MCYWLVGVGEGGKYDYLLRKKREYKGKEEEKLGR